MSKQKGTYNYARVRPSSHPHPTHSTDEQKKFTVFSNLLHNYEKIQPSPRVKTSQIKIEAVRRIRAYQLKFKPIERPLLQGQYFLTQRNQVNNLNRRQSNYSLYLEKSMSKRSNQLSQRTERVSSNKTPTELSKSQLLLPCKVSAIKIQERCFEDNTNLKELKESLTFRRKKQFKKSKVASEIVLNKKYGDETIEPWALKNYQSIVL